MTPRHFVVTLGADSQPLTDDKTLVGYYITIQAFTTNGGAAYVGGRDATGTQVCASDNYGVMIPAPVGGIVAAPYPIDPWHTGLMVNLCKIEIIGEDGDQFAVMFYND